MTVTGTTLNTCVMSHNYDMLQLKGNECECNFLDWLMKALLFSPRSRLETKS